MARERAVLLAAALLLLALAAQPAAAAPGGGQNQSLASEIRELLAAVTGNGIKSSLLREALQNITRCYPGALGDAASRALQVLDDPDRLPGSLREVAAIAAAGPGEPRCPRRVAAHSIYIAVAASFYEPIGLGVLIPPSRTPLAPLPPKLGGAGVVCAPHGYAAVVASAAAGWLDDWMSAPALNETMGGLCVAQAAALAGPPVFLDPEGGLNVSQRLALEAVNRYYLDRGEAPPATPAQVFEDAAAWLGSGAGTAKGLLRLLEAAYPGYVSVLASFADSSDPLIYYAEKRAQGVPRLELPLENPYCRAERLIALSLGENSTAAVRAGALEILGASASYCYAATGRGIVELLKVNPLAPLDAAVVRLGPSGPQRLLAEAARELPRSLAVPITNAEASLIIEKAGLQDMSQEELVAMAVQLKPLLDILSRKRGDPLLLGYLVRAVSLRKLGGSLYIDYASARLVAWALVTEGRVNFPNLVINDMQSPLDPYYVIFTVPGRQRLTLWALGWVTTLTPPKRQSGSGSSGGGGTASGGGGKNTQPATTGAGSQQAVSPETLERLAETLNNIPGGEPYAEIVREAAEAIRSGDYARAAEAAQRLRKLLEAMVGEEAAQRLVEEAAKSLGMDPGQLARLLAEAASLKPASNGVTVDVTEASIIADQLTGASVEQQGVENKAQARKRLIEAAAGIIAESTQRVLESGENPRPLTIKGLDWLLTNTAPGSLFANITGLIGRLASAASTLPSVAAGSAAGSAWQPPQPPPVNVEPPPWLRPVSVLVASALLLALAARAGVLHRAVEGVKLTVAEKRLEKTRSGDGESAAAQAFAALLEAYEKAYRRRRPSETHREYGRGLRGSAASLYWAAAGAYERLRFGRGGRGDLEALRRALREARRLLRGKGGAG